MKKTMPGEVVKEKGIMLTQDEALDVVQTKKQNRFMEEKLRRYEEIEQANAMKEQRNKGRCEGFLTGSVVTYGVLALLAKGRED